MRKQEQIEEISNIITEVAFVQAHEENGDENLSDIVATALYNAGYRKIPEDSKEVEQLTEERNRYAEALAKEQDELLKEYEE